MSHTEHRDSAGTHAIDVHVLVVSSSRTEATDTSGPTIAERLAAAGHTAASRRIVDDDVEAIRAAVRALAASDVPAVILTGGTGITGRDVTPEAVSPLFTLRLDGFGEQFRALSWAEIGAAAMLSRATAGLVGRTVVFAIPGSRAACRLAVDALIGPELAHLVHHARTDRGPAQALAVPARAETDVEDVPFEVVDEAAVATTSPPPTAGAQVGVAPIGSEAPPPAADPNDAPWRRAIAALGGTLRVDVREPLPDSLDRLAPIVDVLHQAGAVGVVDLADGRRFAVYGFPDLVRPSAKVIAVGDGGELGHLLALHRWPTPTGTCAIGGPTPSVRDELGALQEQITGRRGPPGDGQPFAVSGPVVWGLRGRRVLRWDGRAERDDGAPSQVLATLVLEWSQR